MWRNIFIILLILVTPLRLNAADEPSIEVAFSPHAGATELIVRFIGEAKHSIRVAAYSFTSKPIAAALVEASKRGIDVKVVLDKSNKSGKYSAATFLANMGVPTRIDSKYAIMHNKFLVVDEVNLETGSFNFTNAAENKNAENVLVLRNNAGVAKQYRERWKKLWEESEDYKQQ